MKASLCRFAAIPLGLWLAIAAAPAQAQNRGVYPLGLSATNSGITPEAGLTYNNSFLFYARDEERDGNGAVIATGQQSVLLDMNTLVWAAAAENGRLGGARFSCAATIPIANNSLSSSAQGAISGGGGLGDSYFQPIILGWHRERADYRGIVGVLAPTGRYSAGATNNVGNGYWTPVVAGAATIYLTEDRATTFSVFGMYEIHSTQSGTGIQPGDTFDVDYSLMRTMPAGAATRLQVGLVGYGAWQTTARTGPAISPAQEAQRYRVNGVGVGLNVLSPARKVTLGVKYFDEFSNRWTYQGYSLQISAGIGF